MKTLLLILGLCLLLSLIFISRFFYRIGKPVDETISDAYYFHAWKKKIVHAPMGNWFELGYTELEADPESFVVLSRDFGKDKQSIFWKGEVQPVDYKTFVIDEYGIPKDARHVYYDKQYSASLSIVSGADPKTYQPFAMAQEKFEQRWTRDSSSVFLDGKKVDADGKTFIRINQTLAHDAKHVYAIVDNYQAGTGTAEDNTQVIRQELRLSESPVAINEHYARMGNTILHSNWTNTFSFLPFEKIDFISLIDGRNIVVNQVLVSDGKGMQEVDVHSLYIIDRDFMKDKNAVFYDKQKLEGADPGTFSVISEYYSKDQQQVFYKAQILPGANPDNFKVNYATGIGSDGKHSYQDGIRIQQ